MQPTMPSVADQTLMPCCSDRSRRYPVQGRASLRRGGSLHAERPRGRLDDADHLGHRPARHDQRGRPSGRRDHRPAGRDRELHVRRNGRSEGLRHRLRIQPVPVHPTTFLGQDLFRGSLKPAVSPCPGMVLFGRHPEARAAYMPTRAAPTTPALFPKAAATSGALVRSIGRSVGNFFAIPPPRMIKSGHRYVSY